MATNYTEMSKALLDGRGRTCLNSFLAALGLRALAERYRMDAGKEGATATTWRTLFDEVKAAFPVAGPKEQCPDKVFAEIAGHIAHLDGLYPEVIAAATSVPKLNECAKVRALLETSVRLRKKSRAEQALGTALILLVAISFVEAGYAQAGAHPRWSHFNFAFGTREQAEGIFAAALDALAGGLPLRPAPLQLAAPPPIPAQTQSAGMR